MCAAGFVLFGEAPCAQKRVSTIKGVWECGVRSRCRTLSKGDKDFAETSRVWENDIHPRPLGCEVNKGMSGINLFIFYYATINEPLYYYPPTIIQSCLYL